MFCKILFNLLRWTQYKFSNNIQYKYSEAEDANCSVQFLMGESRAASGFLPWWRCNCMLRNVLKSWTLSMQLFFFFAPFLLSLLRMPHSYPIMTLSPVTNGLVYLWTGVFWAFHKFRGYCCPSPKLIESKHNQSKIKSIAFCNVIDWIWVEKDLQITTYHDLRDRGQPRSTCWDFTSCCYR